MPYRLAHEAGEYPGDFGERIWVVDRDTHLFWELTTNYGYREVTSESFYIPYNNCAYEIILLKK